ncbi:uncharacterized protein LOC113091492 isoform X7 [Carassius auratus]|uniref:Uncharacterized protein LOC113091492 isoform X7 n=1 Tax=Carassius auratus TaxID=7957 RepID=A0A6P6NW15_CARAU|nr:uncharacterized protein LOC113091492 isoform X7 [Carassius auratus]
MEFIKEEREDMKIEERFRVKHEDTETHTVIKLEFIKEDVKIEDTFRVKHEDTEEQTDLKEESEELNEIHSKNQSAVRKNRLTQHATDQEIESTIQRWLQLAPDRDGGRRERLRKKEAQIGSLSPTHAHSDV